MKVTNREDAKEILESGGMLHATPWTWVEGWQSCSDGCCDCDFTDTEDLLNHIEYLTDWEGVRSE